MTTLFYTRGHIGTLVVMYSVNVFLTFTLSEIGMSKFWLGEGRRKAKWRSNLAVHGTGLVLCLSILLVMLFEKFFEGAWMTVAVTSVLIAACWAIRTHYQAVAARIREIDRNFTDLVIEEKGGAVPSFDPAQPTAVILVSGYGRLGIDPSHGPTHLSRNIRTSSSRWRDRFGLLHGERHVEACKGGRGALGALRRSRPAPGIPSRSSGGRGRVVEEVSTMPGDLPDIPRIFFAGELVFEEPKWHHRFSTTIPPTPSSAGSASRGFRWSSSPSFSA